MKIKSYSMKGISQILESKKKIEMKRKENKNEEKVFIVVKRYCLFILLSYKVDVT